MEKSLNTKKKYIYKNILLGCDHAAFKLKEFIKILLINMNFNVIDVGVHNNLPVDYPDIAFKVATNISNGIFKLGILICGTGLGMSIAANRYPHVRAALCNDLLTAKMSRLHNNSNLLVMGARILRNSLAEKITIKWLKTTFEKGRHELRLKKLDAVD